MNYPIKIFQHSNMPIILQSALVSNIYFFSQLLYKRFKTNFFVNMIGQWQVVPQTGESLPVGGLCYYLSPPTSVYNFIMDPIHSIGYCQVMLQMCTMLQKYWVDMSGESPREVQNKLRLQNLQIIGHRDTQTLQVLQKIIPPQQQLGGFFIGIITIVQDLFGCIGSGTGILLQVNISFGMFEEICKDKEVMAMMQSYMGGMQQMMPQGGKKKGQVIQVIR